MKLTKSDKEYLLSKGYSNEDFTAIEDASKNMVYTIFDTQDEFAPEAKIKKATAIDLLGRESYLSAIARATFYNSAVSTHSTIDRMGILFERTKF